MFSGGFYTVNVENLPDFYLRNLVNWKFSKLSNSGISLNWSIIDGVHQDPQYNSLLLGPLCRCIGLSCVQNRCRRNVALTNV